MRRGAPRAPWVAARAGGLLQHCAVARAIQSPSRQALSRAAVLALPPPTLFSTPFPSDPFLWIDPRGNFHVINHAYSTSQRTNCSSSWVSSHFFSTDGNVWGHSDQPYGHTVQFDDGTSHSFCTLERPNLSFNDAGLITHIRFAADLVTEDAGCPSRGKGCVCVGVARRGWPDGVPTAQAARLHRRGDAAFTHSLLSPTRAAATASTTITRARCRSLSARKDAHQGRRQRMKSSKKT